MAIAAAPTRPRSISTRFWPDLPVPAWGYGHIELGYDFANGAQGDGWIHALFRYERRDTGCSAETSFGSHMFNVPAVWRNEPNSYIGKPPGLTTRLYLRLTGSAGYGPLPSDLSDLGTVEAAHSETDLILHTRQGDGRSPAAASPFHARDRA